MRREKIEGERREAGLVREKEGKGRGDRLSDISHNDTAVLLLQHITIKLKMGLS